MRKNIPEELKVLAKEAVRLFGTNKDLILMETLIKYDCLEESNMAKILQFDNALLVSQISNLVKERMILKRIKPAVQRAPYSSSSSCSGKLKNVFYYFVNYKSLVDIVRFKLHRMRMTLQENISKESEKTADFFKCTKCPATFKELDAQELFHKGKNDYVCIYCQSLVVEVGAGNAQALMGRMQEFNELTRPLQQLAQAASSLFVEKEPEPDWSSGSDPGVIKVKIVSSSSAGNSSLTSALVEEAMQEDQGQLSYQNSSSTIFPDQSV